MNMYNLDHKTTNQKSREGWERTFGSNKCDFGYVYGQDFEKFGECELCNPLCWGLCKHLNEEL